VRPVSVAVDGAALPAGPLTAWLEPILAARGTSLDASQTAAFGRLQQLATELESFRAARQSTLKKLFSPPAVPRGVYLWGGVGRGKSFLMDGFFSTVDIRRKRRIHFHAFMRDVHEDLVTLKREEDPLEVVAERIAKRSRLICFDEFHVSDIADAMILGRLLSGLFERGVVFVMTTNYPPDGLWPNGLQRERFLPTIRLIKQWLDVVEVDAGIDYRLRTLERIQTWHMPPGPRAEAELSSAFEAMRAGPDEDPKLVVEGRLLPARRRAGSAVWYDFATLCDGPRSQRDYLELACRFSVLFLSDIPRMTAEMGDRARRFTWLVDILYDHRVKLLASAAVPPWDLYTEGPNSQEFSRTASRLIEMQTREYMGEAHVAADVADGRPPA
jgi:cell division protein ZapE